MGCWPKKEKIDFPVRERPSTEVCPEGAAAAAPAVTWSGCLLMKSQSLKHTADDDFPVADGKKIQFVFIGNKGLVVVRLTHL